MVQILGEPHSVTFALGRLFVMKQGIHPDYREATVSCACGAKFQTRSTVGNLKLDICSSCHPFFTGTQKIVDAEGRVERFRKRYAKKAKA